MKTSNRNPIPEGVYNYYIKEDKKIIGSVAFKPNDDGTVSRGIAVTGLGESGSKKIGRKIALGRLQRALKDAESSSPINFRRDACARFATSFEGIKADMFKSGFEVEPTSFETRIIESVSSDY